MENPVRVMAVLKDKKSDDLIIRYTHLISRLFKPKQVYFVLHSLKHDLPGEILNRYPVLAEPEGEPAHDRLKQVVDNRFKPPRHCQVLFSTMKGGGVMELLRFSLKKKIDLILIGKADKKENEPQDLLAEKIVRKAPCPVLLIPAGSRPVMENILVPVDFSDNSRLAVESALRFAAAAKIEQIFCLHVYHVPMSFSRTGKSYEEFSGIMEDIARLSYDRFFDRFDTGKIDVTPVLERGTDAAESIRSSSKALAVDLVVIGNKGRHAALLLGSVSERLVRITDRPLLVAKRKGIWIHLIKTLLSWKFKPVK